VLLLVRSLLTKSILRLWSEDGTKTNGLSYRDCTQYSTMMRRVEGCHVFLIFVRYVHHVTFLLPCFIMVGLFFKGEDELQPDS
jgi:hypothetical protein